MYVSNISNSGYCFPANQVMLINMFRSLWEQHVFWTRSFIISTAANLGDLDLVTKRLLRNPVDFEKVLKPFYGEQKALQFRKLLEEHILLAADLVNAAKAGDTKIIDETRKKWYANADQIAVFLSEINPYWSKDAWQALLYSHLAMTENEAVKRLTGQYAADIMQFDDIQDEALRMADYMSYGIIQQFRD